LGFGGDLTAGEYVSSMRTTWSVTLMNVDDSKRPRPASSTYYASLTRNSLTS